MTIGNLSASARMATAMHSVLLVALLLIAIKMRDIPLSRYNEQKEHNRMILKHVLRHILGPLMRADCRVFFAWYADGHFRRCIASPAAWIANYLEHRNLHNIKNGVCYLCECQKPRWANFQSDCIQCVTTTNTGHLASLIPLQQMQGSQVLMYIKAPMSFGILTV